MRYKYTNIMKYEYTNKNSNGNKIIYPQMSYKIIGCLFEVYNQCGGGHRESFYQKAFCKELSLNGIMYKEQVAVNIEYKGEILERIILMS